MESFACKDPQVALQCLCIVFGGCDDVLPWRCMTLCSSSNAATTSMGCIRVLSQPGGLRIVTNFWPDYSRIVCGNVIRHCFGYALMAFCRAGMRIDTVRTAT